MADEPGPWQRAEQLLADFPVPERDWEAQARAVEARISATAPASTEARWLDAPLPEEAPSAHAAPPASEGEVVAAPAGNSTDTPFPFHSMPSIIEAPASRPEGTAAPAAALATPAAAPPPGAATATPVPSGGNSQSLSALARSVAQKSGRPQSRDIARESLSVAAAARSQSDAMAERVRSARPAPPPPPSHRPTQAQHAPQPAVIAAAPANNNLGPWIAIGGLSMVAALALWVLARPAPPSTLQTVPEAPAVAARATAPRPAEAAPVAEDQAKASPDPALAAAPPRASEGESAPSVAASALPLAPRVAAAAAPVRAGAAVAPAAPAPAAAPANNLASGARPAPESIVLDDTAAAAKVAAKGGAAPQAAASGLRPAAGAPSGGLPDKPSTGAVQAAMGGVMGAARACVAGGVPTPAQVTFGSNGTVQAVTVSGPNAGTASASCIDAALRRARVAPFASSTFTLMVWVRP